MNLFCIQDDFANMAYELVKAAYHLFTKYDYCILTVPPTAQELPLWKNFTLVTPKSDKFPPSVLYISNRFSDDVSVKEAKKEDLDNILSFIKCADCSSDDMNDFKRSFDDSTDIVKSKAFIFEAENQIIGVATLGICFNSSQIVDQFDVRSFINIPRDGLDGKYVDLRNFIVNPLFESKSRLILRVNRI